MRILDEARTYEGALLARTEGLTWMIWGLATSALFACYSLADAYGAPDRVFAVLWMPWVLAGVFTTIALWRSVALAVPTTRARPTRATLLRFTGFSAAFTLLFYVVRPQGPESALMLVGGMWTLMGLLNFWGAPTSGRILAVAVGAPLVVAGAAFALLGAPIQASAVGAIAVSGLVPLVAGGWRAFRG